MSDLKNRVAYITGGSKGIGLSIAKYFLKAGMKVAISGRNPKTLIDAANQLTPLGDVMTIVSNVSNYSDEESANRQIMAKWKKIDVVVANAGIGYLAPVDEMDVDKFKEMIDINLNGVFYTLKANVEALKQSKGYYITISSLAGTNFFKTGAGYNATKFGVVGFTQAAMLDLRQYGIKVTTIMPGSVVTEFNGNVPGPKDDWKMHPDDIGQLAVNLLQMPARTLPSKIEMRPTRPDLK